MQGTRPIKTVKGGDFLQESSLKRDLTKFFRQQPIQKILIFPNPKVIDKVPQRNHHYQFPNTKASIYTQTPVLYAPSKHQ